MMQSDKHMLRAIGLMSGTSMDGIDAALIETDGYDRITTGPALTISYGDDFRQRLRHVVDRRGDTTSLTDVETDMTELHAVAVERLLNTAGLSAKDIHIVGFHGHTVVHEPPRRTWQIGDGAMLAARTGISVVNDFRAADVAAGGQGAPLVPLYHVALASHLPKPLAIVNIGGVANITYIGRGDPIAFDTGPGTALIDDFFHCHTGSSIDAGGALSLTGVADLEAVERFMSHRFFALPAPKSLDRNAFADFAVDLAARLPDTAATLAALTGTAIARSVDLLPEPPARWLVTGGGRHNQAIMRCLRQRLDAPVDPVESVDWNGDALEAQAFAYLAVRAGLGLPITLPSTTGVRQPLSGGTLRAA